MSEFILNTKILHEAGQSDTPQTGDFSWIVLLLLAAIVVASAFIVFKKKAVSVALSLVLVFSFAFVAPVKSFAAEKVSITSSAELEKDKPVQLTISNNDSNPISINSLEISNQALSADTTWDITFKDDYEIKEAKTSENVCVDIPANSSLTFSVYPNVTEIPKGELCDFTFKAVSNHYTSTFINEEDSPENKIESRKTFDFSFNDFVTADNTELNRKIATIEAVFAAIPNTYNNFILDNKSYEVSDRLVFMRTIGFQDNYYCKLWPDQHLDVQADLGVSVTRPTYNLDVNDVTSFCFNHRKINYGDHQTEIINISVGATGGDFEWASNFDFGASKDSDYWKTTGEHPEWINLNNHKGFDIAMNRLLNAYDDYYGKYIDNSESVKKIILINGHSRGGAIANLLGDHFEDLSQNQNIKPFTYTLASPNVTSIEPSNGETTIFNMVNEDDVVALIPGNISYFYKYGQDLEMSIFEDKGISGKFLKDVFLNKSGYGEYNGNDPAYVDDLITEMSMLIETREKAYKLDTDSSKDFTLTFDTQEEASEAEEDFKAKLKKTDYKLSNYAKSLGTSQQGDDYIFKFRACAAFVMQDLSNWLFIYNKEGSEYEPTLAYNETLIEILKEALWVVSGVRHGHIWSSYHLLSSEGDYIK